MPRLVDTDEEDQSVYSTEEEWRGSEFSVHYEVRLSANGESIGFMGRIEKE